VLLGGFSTAEDADVLAGRLLEVLAEPVVFDGLRLSIEGSVGIACHPQDASSFDELLKRADVALYQAKDTRGSYAHYSGERDESSLHRLALAAELRAALADDQLVVHFQPQVDLQSGALTGAEALVRWEHPVRGLLAAVGVHLGGRALRTDPRLHAHRAGEGRRRGGCLVRQRPADERGGQPVGPQPARPRAAGDVARVLQRHGVAPSGSSWRSPRRR
jgi:hypothetical protein